MDQYLGLGNGSDGEVVLSSHSPIDAPGSGAINTDQLAGNNGAFQAGQFIKIRQEKGTGYGKQEINKIKSYNSTTGVITTAVPLKNNYYTIGQNSISNSDRAQVIVMPQYSKVTFSSTFYIKPWNGSVGGHLTFLCSGQVITQTGVGQINGVGRGFRGGDRENQGSPPSTAEQGDSPSGDPSRATNNNNLGGGGAKDQGAPNGDFGGGAGNAGPGQARGVNDPGIPNITGDAGNAVDSLNLLERFIMGAGGGGGIGPGGNDRGGFGGSGGATFDIYCYEFLNYGLWNISGQVGNSNSFYGSYTDVGSPTPGGSQGCGGGGGAAGDGRITCVKFTNIGAIIADPGAGGASNNPSNGNAGNGAYGVLGIRCCTYSNTGTISPAPLINQGGHPFCGSGAHII